MDEALSKQRQLYIEQEQRTVAQQKREKAHVHQIAELGRELEENRKFVQAEDRKLGETVKKLDASHQKLIASQLQLRFAHEQADERIRSLGEAESRKALNMRKCMSIRVDIQNRHFLPLLGNEIRYNSNLLPLRINCEIQHSLNIKCNG